MYEDLRIIKLKRKIIREIAGILPGNQETGETIFATDYFDFLSVESKSLSDPLTSILGIWPDTSKEANDVSVQSYTIYCDTEMKKKYPEEIRYTDLFLQSTYPEAPFLSIIQVHITPEACAHFEQTSDYPDIMTAAFKDLNQILTEFYRIENLGIKAYRIYKMLSTGDFAIVIRSTNAKDSFRVSSIIRQRRQESSKHKPEIDKEKQEFSEDKHDSSGKGEDKSPIQDTDYVLYKTYTLLTILDCSKEIPSETHEHLKSGDITPEIVPLVETERETSEKEASENDFVLRCCYSNHYWAEKEKVDQFFENKKFSFSQSFYGLNGRYDFCLKITEKEFKNLFPYITEYKKDQQKKHDLISSFDENSIGINVSVENYLIYLIKKDYLSYINERCLLCNELLIQKGLIQNAWITDLPFTKKKSDYMENQISSRCSGVLDNYQEVKKKIDQLKGYRKNLKHYINLLERLIILCQGINGISDTRIFAIVLLEQLEVILESIKIYLAFLDAGNGDSRLLDLLEDYTRESVCALDSYAQYIRNNNLQSLQTPNFNIESNTSMEKVLIGYSELLHIFTDYYQEWQISKKMKITKKEFLPVVVPVLSQKDVMVDVMFQEGVTDNWEQEIKIRGVATTTKTPRYCMVISTPTLSELCNIGTMVPSLFHEVAHQFRYEPRRERNDFLLYYTIRSAMHILAQRLVNDIQKNGNGIDITRNLANEFEVPLTEAYLETNYKYCPRKSKVSEFEYSYRESPLMIFANHLLSDFKESLSYNGEKKEINQNLQLFVRKVSGYTYAENREIYQHFIVLSDLLDELIKSQTIEYEAYYNKITIILRCAFAIVRDTVEQNLKHTFCSGWRNGVSFHDWIRQDPDQEPDWKDLWESSIHDTLEKKEEIMCSKLWDCFFYFSSWIHDQYDRFYDPVNFNSSKRDRFLKLAYSKLCTTWSNILKSNVLLADPDNSLLTVGRAIGIDYEHDSNQKTFYDFMVLEIDSAISYMAERIKEMIMEYREETADIMMCKVMKLTPFGYLHILSINWPDTFQEIYFRRCINVLAFTWCLKEDENKNLKPNLALLLTNLYEAGKELKNTICAVLHCLSKEIQEKKYRDLITILEEICIDVPDLSTIPTIPGPKLEKQIVVLYDLMTILIDICESAQMRLNDILTEHLSDFREEELKKLKKEIQPIKNYQNVGNMLRIVCSYIGEQYSYFLENEKLILDYAKGASYLDSINQDMCVNIDLDIRSLGEFCKQSVKLMNEPHLQYENDNELRELNKKSIEFLLKMYDRNRIRYSKKAGGISEDD